MKSHFFQKKIMQIVNRKFVSQKLESKVINNEPHNGEAKKTKDQKLVKWKFISERECN